jgi:hypothetical protein
MISTLFRSFFLIQLLKTFFKGQISLLMTSFQFIVYSFTFSVHFSPFFKWIKILEMKERKKKGKEKELDRTMGKKENERNGDVKERIINRRRERRERETLIEKEKESRDREGCRNREIKARRMR